MSKELLRNGGFERAEIDFWELLIGKSFAVTTTNPKFGTYAGKLTGAGGAKDSVATKDLIAVSPYELLRLTGYLYCSQTKTFTFVATYYDSEGNKIESVNIHSEYATTAWYNYTTFIAIPANVSYVSLEVEVASLSLDSYLLLDGFSIERVDLNSVAVKEEAMFEVVNDVLRGGTSGVDFFTGAWYQADYFLDVTKLQRVAAGADVTLTVTVRTKDRLSDVWRTVVTFADLSTTTDAAVTTQEYKGLIANIGWIQEAYYMLSGEGALGGCDFTLGVVYKR